MKTFLCALLLLPLLVISSTALAGTELEAVVQTRGREVEVHVRDADGRPVEGARVRLLYGRQIVVASGTTNRQGRWVHTAAEPGAYEAVVEIGATGETTIRQSFVIRDAPRSAEFPWLSAVFGGVAVLGVLVLAASRKATVVSGIPSRWRVVLGIFVLLSATGGVWSWTSRPRKPAPPPSRDVAGAAREFLRSQNVKPLSGPLEKLLADASVKKVQTQPHPLLGQLAPDFKLTDTKQNEIRLRDQVARGPVVLIFYYGYHCDHCVGQLFASNDDIDKFHELGAELLAISADPPESTLDRFQEYGAFSFPVLFDPANRTAMAYGVFELATPTAPERLQHGTFVIGRDGRVHWAYRGKSPFAGNLTLLYEVACLEGRLPGENAPRSEGQQP